MTRAQDQAVFLRALAAHLDMHIDLATPHIEWRPTGPADLHIAQLDDAAAALLAWTESIGVDELQARVMGNGHVHLHALGRIGGHAVDVWERVPALMGTGLTFGEIVPLDVLGGVT